MSCERASSLDRESVLSLHNFYPFKRSPTYLCRPPKWRDTTEESVSRPACHAWLWPHSWKSSSVRRGANEMSRESCTWRLAAWSLPGLRLCSRIRRWTDWLHNCPHTFANKNTPLAEFVWKEKIFDKAVGVSGPPSRRLFPTESHYEAIRICWWASRQSDSVC